MYFFGDDLDVIVLPSVSSFERLVAGTMDINDELGFVDIIEEFVRESLRFIREVRYFLQFRTSFESRLAYILHLSTDSDFCQCRTSAEGFFANGGDGRQPQLRQFGAAFERRFTYPVKVRKEFLLCIRESRYILQCRTAFECSVLYTCYGLRKNGIRQFGRIGKSMFGHAHDLALNGNARYRRIGERVLLHVRYFEFVQFVHNVLRDSHDSGQRRVIIFAFFLPKDSCRTIPTIHIIVDAVLLKRLEIKGEPLPFILVETSVP